jgi:hypothetical protein
MATMASWLLSTFDVHDIFLARQNKHQPWEKVTIWRQLEI